MLPAQFRMKRATEFATTVRQGVRAVQSDIVVHAWSDTGSGPSTGPRVGLIVAKSVGSAIERHRVARRVRHVARAVLADMDSSDRIVVRALPSSRNAISARLEQQLRTGLRRTHELRGSRR